MLRLVFVALISASLFAQDTLLDRLAHEAALLRTIPEDKFPEDHIAAAGPLHHALLNWIESRLPTDRGLLSVTFNSLEPAMNADLIAAGLTEKRNDLDPMEAGFGLAEVSLQRLPELPNSLIVTAGVSVPCGIDEAVYMYSFDADSRRRVMEDHPKSKWGYSWTGVQLSDAEPDGTRLLLIHRMSVQCASSWMSMAYSVYRIGYLPGRPSLLLSGDHGLWIGSDYLEFVLKPHEFLMAFTDSSIDSVVHNRTQIHRFNFEDGIHRLDPVALQPQDFVEEWLTAPWNEMEERSAPKTKDWHIQLGDESAGAEYSDVLRCIEKPDHWLIVLDIIHVGDKKFDEPKEVNFLVRDLGNYHYRMEAVDSVRPAGCPGTGSPSETHPTLSAEALRNLR